MISENSQHQELWNKLQNYSIDLSYSSFPFSTRLAKENGWNLAYTQRVIEEYKKFLFLCVVADHVVCPSEQVDQAWHLHLVYTKSYWNDLCKEVLAKPIHHNPTEGGKNEFQKHLDLYSRTLNSYNQFFGKEAPSDIWPEASIRFGEDTCYQRINLKRNYILPKFWKRKPRTRTGRRRKVMHASFFPFLLMAAFPFNMKGPDFLTFYGICFIFALIYGFVLRTFIYKGYLQNEHKTNVEELSTSEIAYLSGNKSAVINTTIANLVHLDVLTVTDDTRGKIKANAPLAAEITDLEKEVFNFALLNKDGRPLSEFHTGFQKEMEPIKSKLETEGLLVPEKFNIISQIIPALFLIALLIAGLIKIYIGMQRDKPVLFLVIFSAITTFAAFAMFKKPSLTSMGKNILSKLKSKNVSLKNNAAEMETSEYSPDFALMVALFGVSVIPTGLMDNFVSSWSTLPAQNQSWTSGTGTDSGCGGDGGCGGGCGGCGGCGD